MRSAVQPPRSGSVDSIMTCNATLLFCHGGGFCKDVWAPVMKRLRRSPLLQGVAVDMVAFDFPYHGANRDVSEHATLHLENAESPRVTHPAMHWAEWSHKAVQRQVQAIRHAQAHEQKRSALIGIGHSMGGAALWKTEALHPGTFDGLVLFEPMCTVDEHPNQVKSVDFLVSITLKRPSHWSSFEEAEAEILSARNFARWHPESLRNYIKGAVVRVSPENNVIDPDVKFALSCHPHIEASLYSGKTARLSDEQVARVRCPITFQYGGRSQLFFPAFKQPLVDALPHLYRVAAPVANTTHALVMEDPDTCVDRIVECLEQLPPFESEANEELAVAASL